MVYISAYPHSSIRHVYRLIGISVVAVHNILKTNKMHPNIPELIQYLRIGDNERSLQFLSWFSIQFEIDNLFYNSVLWTDESKFTKNGIMNKKNNRFWDDTNPHWSREKTFRKVWGINVWCGLIGGILLGPYFYVEHLQVEDII